jgi:hypothetical protein
MDERLLRLEEKLDKVVDTQAEIKADLQEHMRRTLIAESNIDKLAANMAPVQEHVAFIRVLGRLSSIIIGIAGAVAAFLALK